MKRLLLLPLLLASMYAPAQCRCDTLPVNFYLQDTTTRANVFYQMVDADGQPVPGKFSNEYIEILPGWIIDSVNYNLRFELWEPMYKVLQSSARPWYTIGGSIREIINDTVLIEDAAARDIYFEKPGYYKEEN